MSIHKLTRDLNCMITYQSDSCVIQDLAMRRTIGSDSMHNGVYVYKGMMQGSAFTTSKKDDTALWHYVSAASFKFYQL